VAAGISIVALADLYTCRAFESPLLEGAALEKKGAGGFKPNSTLVEVLGNLGCQYLQVP